MTRIDVLSPDQRRLCMRNNRGRDTKPELVLRRLCWALGLRYRVNTNIVGKPDFVFSRQKIAVFVDGCFWHGCPQHYKAPSTRSEFWKEKLNANRKRDIKVTQELSEAGWLVLRFWEHDLRKDAQRQKLALQTRAAVVDRRSGGIK